MNILVKHYGMSETSLMSAWVGCAEAQKSLARRGHLSGLLRCKCDISHSLTLNFNFGRSQCREDCEKEACIKSTARDFPIQDFWRYLDPTARQQRGQLTKGQTLVCQWAFTQCSCAFASITDQFEWHSSGTLADKLTICGEAMTMESVSWSENWPAG
jgi:hypothetical protein